MTLSKHGFPSQVLKNKARTKAFRSIASTAEVKDGSIGSKVIWASALTRQYSADPKLVSSPSSCPGDAAGEQT